MNSTKIKLLKTYDASGEVSYAVEVSGKILKGTVTYTMQEAMEMYTTIKSQYTQSRVEVLMEEEI
jgi:hypothetical protein